MGNKNESVEHDGRCLVRIVLDKGINEKDSNIVTSVVFGAPECKRFYRSFLSYACRCVDLSRFAQVIQKGIDVEPTDSFIWVASLDKAMEYADFPKLVLVLDVARLRKTFLKLPPSSSDEKLALIRETYPTIIEDEEGFWCSRLPADEPRIGRGNYEESYAYWIQGDAKQALVGLIVIESSENSSDEGWQKIKASFLTGA